MKILRPGDGKSVAFRNAGILTRDYTVSQLRKPAVWLTHTKRMDNDIFLQVSLHRKPSVLEIQADQSGDG